MYGESKVNDFIQNCVSPPSLSQSISVYLYVYIYMEYRPKKKVKKKKVEVDDVGVVSVILVIFFSSLFAFFLRYFFINLMVVDVEL